jgi:hypothetical protein
MTATNQTMNNHKATPEQWKADKYDWSKADTEAMDNDSAFRCILELRARVEALEAQANCIPEAIQRGIEDMLEAVPSVATVTRDRDETSSTPPSVATDEKLRAIWDRSLNREYALRDIYNLGVAHGQARSREVAEPAPVAGGLVDRVARAVTLGSDPNICINIWSDIAARTAIIEVAKWLEECDLACARGAARLLNQEAQ